MTENTNRKQIPTPADLDPNRAPREPQLKPVPEPSSSPAEAPAPAPTPADVAPRFDDGGRVHRVPVVELSNEQRMRVEALHAARRVLGNPHTREGQIPAGWSWQAIELANYILTGAVDCGHAEEDEPAEDTDGPALGGAVVVDLNSDSPLPDGIPPALAEKVEQFRAAARKIVGSSAEDRVLGQRRYVDGYRDKPDGYKDLHHQGIYPVDGAEPPRDEPLHDVHCNRWTYDAAMGQWVREDAPSRGPLDARAPVAPNFGTWGPALAEHGPFHVCA